MKNIIDSNKEAILTEKEFCTLLFNYNSNMVFVNNIGTFCYTENMTTNHGEKNKTVFYYKCSIYRNKRGFIRGISSYCGVVYKFNSNQYSAFLSKSVTLLGTKENCK